MKRLATALTVLVLTASIAPATVAGSIAPASQRSSVQTTGQASGEAYAGTHISFDASERAVTDYAVHGETMLSSVKIESKSSVEDSALVDVGASLSAVTTVEGAGLSVGAKTQTEASVEAENGATITAHDNDRGVLVVASGNQSDYVVANLSSGAEASAESDSQVEVTTANGTEGTLLVVGEGNATVNDDGDVTAQLGANGRLVFRSYPDGKDDGDEKQEQLIADGEAKAEAYVMAASESENESGSDGADESQNASETGQVVVDTVSYDENTTVEITETAEGEVTFAVNRTTHEGTVLITSVSEQALNAAEGLTVTVDGEAAAEAATHTQLQSAIGSEQSRYLVHSSGEGSAEADASADVLVAVNHFSERTVSLQSASGDGSADDGETTGDGETTSDGRTTGSGETSDDAATNDGEATDSEMEDDTTQSDESDSSEDNSSGGIPGFGVTAAVVALAGGVLLARLQ